MMKTTFFKLDVKINWENVKFGPLVKKSFTKDGSVISSTSLEPFYINPEYPESSPLHKTKFLFAIAQTQSIGLFISHAMGVPKEPSSVNGIQMNYQMYSKASAESGELTPKEVETMHRFDMMRKLTAAELKKIVLEDN